MTRVKCNFLLLGLALSMSLYSQKTLVQFDSSMKVGVILSNQGSRANSNFCYIGKNTFQKYTPYEVTSYVFEDGTSFYSREYSFDGYPKRYFYERLNEGEIRMYYLNTLDYIGYFIETDTSFEMMAKHTEDGSYKDLLLKYTGNNSLAKDAVSRTYYSRTSLKRYMNWYNSMDGKAFLSSRLSVVFGYSRFTNSAVFYSNYIFLNEEIIQANGFSAGVNIDIPLWKNYISLRPELSMEKATARLNYNHNDEFYDYYSSQMYLLPAVYTIFKYSAGDISIYGLTGISGGFMLYDKSALYYSQVQTDAIILQDIYEEIDIPRQIIYFNLGIGLEYALNGGQSIFTEIRNKTMITAFTWNIPEYKMIGLFAGYKF